MANNRKRRVRKAKPETTKRVIFDYIKSTAHRVIAVGGAHGGPTPNGQSIHMSLFNERQPIPVRETYGLGDDGKLLALQERTQRGANIIREVEATLLFDVRTAKLLQAWLKQQLEKIEAVEKAQNQQAKTK